MTLDELYAKATHLRCAMCQHMFPNNGRHDIGFVVASEADIEDVYDEVNCCNDPLYDGLIISDTPMFPPDDPDSEANQEAYIAANPRLDIHADQWHYQIDDDLLDVIKGQG